jgi:beta-glucosidase
MKPGSTQTAKFPLRRKDVMVWDTVLQKWRLPKDNYVVVHIGASSRKLPYKIKHTF